MITLIRRYDLECAHQLTRGLPEGHRCRRLHGHRYEVALYVSGLPDENGVLIEYADLDTVVWPVLKLADHHSLNTLSERDSSPIAAKVSANPTVELLAAWIWQSLAGLVRTSKADGQQLRLARVSVMEDARAGAEWAPTPDVHPDQRRDGNG